MLACTKKKSHPVIQALIRRGADPRLLNKDGWSCFHLACREVDEGVVECLLDCDATLWDTVSKNGRTPLHTAGNNNDDDDDDDDNNYGFITL